MKTKIISIHLLQTGLSSLRETAPSSVGEEVVPHFAQMDADEADVEFDLTHLEGQVGGIYRHGDTRTAALMVLM